MPCWSVAAPASLSEDGETVLVLSNLTGTMQLYRSAPAGGPLEQLTDFAEPVDGFFVPRRERILVQMDAGGNERHQLYLLDSPLDPKVLPAAALIFGGVWLVARGLPDLPPGEEWPTKDGRPLAFLAQIALAAVPRVEGEPRLPWEGLLSFFYYLWEERWGFDPKDRGCWQVLYSPDASGLVRTEAPEGAFATEWSPEEDEPFLACRVTFEVVTTYPELSDAAIQRDDGEQIMELYDETVGEGQGEESPLHHLLGHPFVVQNPMEIECQLVSNGFNCGSELSVMEKEVAKPLEAGAKDWTLLLQLDSDDEPGWMWGDMGILYFWIRRQDLEAAEFAKGWGILQCA